MDINVKETLSVRNFVVIKKADIELKKLNIIIGPQANGKSLLAKLCFFFRNIPDKLVSSIRKLDTKRELDRALLADFEQRFPRYSWEGSSFHIDYNIGAFRFEIEGKKNAKGKTTLYFRSCETFVKIFNGKKALLQRKTEEARTRAEAGHFSEWQLVNDNIWAPLREEFGYLFGFPMFIPASRSFFANLQKNIFTFLASNIEIDPFLKEFGSLYEHGKSIYNQRFLTRGNRAAYEQFQSALEAIVCGKYEFQDDQDWIVSKNRKINLAHASSGQQESLPMLITLTVWPIMRKLAGCTNMYFIEEPEAHLFPTSQSRIVTFLSQIMETTNSRIFITSHSPYILSAFNNLILAHDKLSENKITLSEFQEINGPSFPLAFEDVSAYTVSDGVSQNIANTEYRMIGADMLDNISEHFEDVMNALLTCGEDE
ncbi:AAA family ATPase [Pseudomonas sp. LPD2]